MPGLNSGVAGKYAHLLRNQSAGDTPHNPDEAIRRAKRFTLCLFGSLHRGQSLSFAQSSNDMYMRER